MKQKLFSFALALSLCLTALSVFAAEYDPAHCPTAARLELETYRGTSAPGQLQAEDPDGDALTYALTTEPMKGTVTVEADGSFVYTPAQGKGGKDYFGYKAIDEAGNESPEATVTIRIRRQKSGVQYDDMQGDSAARAAVWLAEQGAYVGAQVAGGYHFCPEAAVSRSEFLALAETLSGEPVLQGVMTTGFGDDAAIPAWAKGYVSTARMTGAVSGYSDGEKMVFSADRPITRAECAVILDRMLSPAPAAAISEAVPAWAAQAVANLGNCSLYADPSGASAAITRADCAQLLYDVFQSRG